MARRASAVILTVFASSALLLTACAPDPTPQDVPRVARTYSAPVATPNPTASGANRLRVVTIGDSLMSGYGLDLGQAWPTLLANKQHVTLTNLACGGMGFVVSGDCGTPYSGLVPALAALQPDVVIVQASSNDFGEDPDDVRAETITTVQEMREAAPAALIVGLSTIWNDEDDLPDEVASTSEDLSDAIALVDGIFIDVGQPLQDHPSWMQDDDIHPTARGQQSIEETVRAKLVDDGVLR
ncbi:MULTISPECIES: SGNH/GDSL hydrolase family protein [unclassified Microbacterium]|uniref:SGNH/GDSL hydrolase family protein n=1 Tax=unclassified Microbacterium TaxID=2609290 RepID=UPI0030187EA4